MPIWFSNTVLLKRLCYIAKFGANDTIFALVIPKSDEMIVSLSLSNESYVNVHPVRVCILKV